MNKTKKSIVALLLAAALLVSAVGMASADPSLKWDLDSGTPLTMWEPAHAETGSVNFNDGDSNVWRADQKAVPAGGVYFTGEQWQGRLTTGKTLPNNYTVDIGYSDANGANFNSNGNTGSQSSYEATYGASNFLIAANGFTVPQDKYLALRVNATGDSFTVTTTGSSYVIWPYNDPLYPYPELSTIILMSTGLLALFGYVVYRRRNNKQ